MCVHIICPVVYFSSYIMGNRKFDDYAQTVKIIQSGP